MISAEASAFFLVSLLILELDVSIKSSLAWTYALRTATYVRDDAYDLVRGAWDRCGAVDRRAREDISYYYHPDRRNVANLAWRPVDICRLAENQRMEVGRNVLSPCGALSPRFYYPPWVGRYFPRNHLQREMWMVLVFVIWIDCLRRSLIGLVLDTFSQLS